MPINSHPDNSLDTNPHEENNGILKKNITNGIDSPDIESFWLSPDADRYAKWAKEVSPDNRPSVIAAHEEIGRYLMENLHLPPYVLDFGCFRGESSRRVLSFLEEYTRMYSQQLIPQINDIIQKLEVQSEGTNDPSKQKRLTELRELKAYLEKLPEEIKVMGIDCVQENIDIALKNYPLKKESKLGLQYLPAENPITEPNLFSVALLSFVDQVIGRNTMLSITFEKVYKALRKGGMIVILRLAEESFDPSVDYFSYRHNKEENPVPFNERPGYGEGFTNELLTPVRNEESGEFERDEFGNIKTTSLKFTDHFRRRAYIARLLTKSGFCNVRHILLGKNLEINTDGDIAVGYKTARRDVNIELGIDPDFDYPVALHELIIAFKEDEDDDPDLEP